MDERAIDFQNLEEFRNVGSGRAALRADADALAVEFADRADAGILTGHELERRIVHREECAHRPQLLAPGPRARPVPGLECDPQGDEPDLDFTRFQQLDVLPGTSVGRAVTGMSRARVRMRASPSPYAK